VPPLKRRASDCGYDLTLIDVAERRGTVTLFGTGLKIEPEYGWYFDLLPRSSIIRTGYIFANSVGVIDRTYRGEILLPLIKVDHTAPDLELPSRIAQIVQRPIVHARMELTEELSPSSRDAGGFGSTG